MPNDVDSQYSSHLPVLREFGQRADIKRVVEWGAGPFSTPAFMDPAIFPNLVSLLSIESEPMWCIWVQSRFQQDHRLTLLELPEFPQICLILHNPYDLAFVDGMTVQMRYNAAAKSAYRARFVILHDAQVSHYARIIKGFKYVRIFDPGDGTPHTAIMSMTEDVSCSI